MTERNWRLRRLQLYITLEVKERRMGATQAAWLAVCTEQPRCLRRKENEVGRWGGRMRRRVDHPAVSYTKRLRNRLVSATSEQKKLKNIKRRMEWPAPALVSEGAGCCWKVCSAHESGMRNANARPGAVRVRPLGNRGWQHSACDRLQQVPTCADGGAESRRSGRAGTRCWRPPSLVKVAAETKETHGGRPALSP